MLKEQRSCWCSALLSWDQSFLGWWPPQICSPTFPPGNPVTALCSRASSTWWQLIRALYILFFKVFILCSTFFCCLVWTSHFLALCLSIVRWSTTTRWLAVFNWVIEDSGVCWEVNIKIILCSFRAIFTALNGEKDDVYSCQGGAAAGIQA